MNPLDPTLGANSNKTYFKTLQQITNPKKKKHTKKQIFKWKNSCFIYKQKKR